MARRSVRILSLFSLCASGLALGIFLYGEYTSQHPLLNDEVEKQKLLEDSRAATYPESYRLERLIINLKSPATRLRFLDVQIHLIPFAKGKHDLLARHRPQIYDAINRIGGEMTPREINSIHGKIIFEKRIKEGINQILGQTVIREVQYSKFTVQ